MHTHREIRTAIVTIMQSSGAYLNVVFPHFVVYGEQDELLLSFENPRAAGTVLGWQVRLSNEIGGSGETPAQERGLDSSATLDIMRWDIMAFQTVSQSNAGNSVPGDSELPFLDMVFAVKAVFRETPTYDPFLTVGELDGITTAVDDRTGLMLTQNTVETWGSGRTHIALCSLSTQQACEPEA